MSGDFIYAAERESFGAYSKTGEEIPVKPAGSRKLEKGLKRLFILAGIILGAEFIWLFGVSPCIPLSTVEVRDFPGFERPDVLRFAGIGEGASFISVNARAIEEILGGHYLVESARVVKRFPDRLSIFLEPRRAVALSLAQVQNRLVPVYYDQGGVIFRIGKSEWSPSAALPILSGLVIEEPNLGMRLPAAFTPLLTELGKIGTHAPELLSAVSEIRINRKPFDGFDLVLYPVHNPVRVRIGNDLNEDTLRYVLLMLDVFGSGANQPGEIDFRSGMGSYKVKEAPSGE
jgi:cell division protein FtsQ